MSEDDKTRCLPNSVFKSFNISSHIAKPLFVWCPRRESNPQLPLRRQRLYPFNYEGNIYNIFTLKSFKCEYLRCFMSGLKPLKH